jgi:hypothetical protein
MRFTSKASVVLVVLLLGSARLQAGDFTPAYPAQPPQGMLYWGAAISGNGDPVRHEQPTGTALPVRRTFFSWEQRNGYLHTIVAADHAANRLPWISVKTPPWREVANGQHDAGIDELLKWLAAQPKPVWLTVWHEPENDLNMGTAADHVAMNRRVRQRMTALGVKNVTLALILMSWTWDSRSGRNPEEWWGTGIYDILGLDPYNEKEDTLLKPVWAQIRKWAQAKGVEIAAGEWGMRGTDAAAGQRVRDWYEAAVNSHADGQGARVVALSAFDSSLNSPNGSWELKGEQLNVFHQLMSDPRTARIGPLSAPSGLGVSAVSTSRIDLSWTENSFNESGFKIERKTGAGGAWSVIATVGANVKAYQNTGLSASTNYIYRVRAFNAAGTSAYSNEAGTSTKGAANQAPTVKTQAKATPNPVTGKTTVLSVLGDDDQGEGNLSYTWTTTGTPPAAVSFSSNGNNGAKQTTATFSKLGSYSFNVTLKDAGGLTASSNVTVTVNATVTNISVTPASATVQSGKTQSFSATAKDQFGGGMTPAFGWTVSGGGSISGGGLFTAGASAGGPFTVTASAGGKSGTASVSVYVPAPVGTGNGLRGEYFDDMFYAVPRLCRTDASVDFDWGTGSPAASIGADTFCAFWTGNVQAQYTETYTFTTLSDDGVQLRIDGQTIIDNWTDHAPAENSGTITLVAGQKYAINLNYYENGGGATIKLLWSSPSTPRQVIPQSQLYSSPLRTPENPTGTTAGLNYSYYHGDWSLLPDFDALTPVKTGIVSDFNLGVRTQNDQFGFKYTGFVDVPYDGTYAFYTSSDDGSQFYIGDTLVVDNDGLHGLREETGWIGLKAGKHALTVMFFEKTGNESLSVSWSGPGFAKQGIPVGRLLHVVPANGDGLLAAYFDNENFSGKSVTRVDPTIDFNWGLSAPVAGFGVDTYSVRWTGFVVPPAGGSYTFTARTDDGVRLWINGQLIIDYWQLRGVADSSGTVTLNAGQRYAIKMEYYNSPKHGVAQLYWAGPGIGREIVPQKRLYSK